jgi:hypothetical protein
MVLYVHVYSTCTCTIVRSTSILRSVRKYFRTFVFYLHVLVRVHLYEDTLVQATFVSIRHTAVHVRVRVQYNVGLFQPRENLPLRVLLI